MPPVGFGLLIPTSERPQTHDLDRAATGIGNSCIPCTKLNYKPLRYSIKWYSPYRTLTYSMVQSPSWAANWFAPSQEIPRISRNPKVLYRTHKRPPPAPILSQPNPVHIPTSHLLEIHPTTPRSPQWSLSLRFPHQDPIDPPLLTHTRHMPSPSHSSRIYYPHNIGWGEELDKLPIRYAELGWGWNGVQQKCDNVSFERLSGLWFV